jgi:hypothetical protein
MAISIQTLRTLIKVRALTDATSTLKLATIGYPDCLFSRDQAEALLGEGFCDDLPVRSDSEQILRWHNLHNELNGIYDTDAFMKAFNIELTVFDINEVRGGEIIHDFNLPVLTREHNQYDIVYDGGSLEHIFNVSQALINMLHLCKVNGHIIHSNPLCVFNHGFYNFNPTFYADFYLQNGHEIIDDMEAIRNEKLGYSSATLPHHKRFKMVGDYWIAVLAKKTNSKALIYPHQTKYKVNPAQAVK